MDRYLIFDLGGTSVKYAVSDKDGAFDTAGAFATPREGMERMLEEMERVYEAVQTGPGVTEAVTPAERGLWELQSALLERWTSVRAWWEASAQSRISMVFRLQRR